MHHSNNEDWFKTWFNSSYYHILYHNRDENEAKLFMNNLCDFLDISDSSRILDLACGNGRHSKFLNEKGFIVTGLDLSTENIESANRYNDDKLDFFVHDMRKPHRVNYYDYIFNLFSSFGYFETNKEHIDSIKNNVLSLKKDGIFVIDFMNVNKVISNLIKEEEKTIKGVNFKISRSLQNNHIVKKIQIVDNGKKHLFIEKVRALTYSDFEVFIQKSGLEIINLLGNYEMDTFDKFLSDRLIIIAKKL